ncbi:MAG: HAD-IB family hydrolase [Chitinophagales bacterium]
MKKILNTPKFQAILAQIAEEKGVSIKKVNKEAKRYLKELYAIHQPIANIFGTETASYILSRGYEKTIDVNPSEIKALTKLMRHHPIAFVMTHKTYIDMMVLAVVLARHGLSFPYTFSGINMSFLGLGQLGRKTGVIFIRRSFKDNLVYKATLRYFIANVIEEKGDFMWAIEGTRSRTGKLVWPKMGILKYIMEGEQDSQREVKYIPVSIVYDLIPDVQEMTEEGRGKLKKPESLTWFLNYIRKMGDSFGKISVRLGTPIDIPKYEEVQRQYTFADTKTNNANTVSRFALQLVHKINEITPVTTTSLICTTLLSKYALSKRAIESDIAALMQLIENQESNALVDRGKAIGESVQIALSLLTKANIVQQQGESLHAQYNIAADQYLPATYYANMAVHHLFHRAFTELALLKIAQETENRSLSFWTEIMTLRDIFKFEFFYSNKAQFTDEIENDLSLLDANWHENLLKQNGDIRALLQQQKVLVAPVVLYHYIEAYKVVMYGLQKWEFSQEFDEKKFIEACLILGEKLHWQGQIHRLESVSKPFILNGLRLAKNLQLIPSTEDKKQAAIAIALAQLEDLATRLKMLQGIILDSNTENAPLVPIERDIVPGSKTEGIVQEILEGESGAHIGAFFDLDRTLISGFSAKEFFQTRLLSGKVTPRELIAQFAGVLVYAVGNRNFASLAAASAQGVKGVKEQVFIEVGEEVYEKYLAHSIYPESRAMVAAHVAKGHTVAIISAATPYQVNPIARDMGIEHVMCTRMEVVGDTFTGKVVEPACWGEGKAYAARELTKEFDLDLGKSYFYTDSAEDMPLMEIVGNPVAMNPDTKLASVAYENDWPIYRFNEEIPSKWINLVRTGLTASTLFPAVVAGVATGAKNLSWRDGVNSMMAAVGDLGTAMSGMKLLVKGEHHLWSHRPAVFLFNHQSGADMFITAKLLRKDARAVAKKELKKTPIMGQLMQASGVIFVDRSNKDKAIEALKPAVEALKNGTSIMIAPEGTRSYDYTLGKFKKGAFHLAMQAGVPIVPIVIKNAHDAMPRGTSIIRPATVEVVVLPAIPIEGWNLENLEERIDEVRGMYLKELGQEE